MEQAATAIVISVFIIFLFVPTIFLRTNNTNKENLGQNLHFATMALSDCVEIENVNYDQLSEGYSRYIEAYDAAKSNIAIDESKLLLEFNNILFQSCQDPELYAKTQASILNKVLIYNDRFVIAGYDNNGPKYNYRDEIKKYKDGVVSQFDPPYYFTYTAGGNTYYLNTKNDNLYDKDNKMIYFSKSSDTGGTTLASPNQNFISYLLDVDNTGVSKNYYLNVQDNKIYNTYINATSDDVVGYRDVTANPITPTTPINILYIPRSIAYIGLSKKEKNDAIIHKINSVISDYTGGMIINFPNPEDVNSRVNIRQKDLNFFEGTTFFVIYRENSYLNVRNEQMEFKNNLVSGYTLK